jgi:hypothetical protein
MGACSVVTFGVDSQNPGFVDPVRPTILDAGAAISIRGPRGDKQLTKREGVYYGELGGGTQLPPGVPNVPGLPASQPDYLEPGSYTISAPGGTGPDSVGNFNVQFTMPQMVTWTNEASISTVTRTSDLPITWTGGAPDSLVHMTGMSINNQVAAMFICTERASVGRFTIPSYVLSVLPPSAGQIPGSLSVGGSTMPTRFVADRLDAGYVSASSSTQKTVTWR